MQENSYLKNLIPEFGDMPKNDFRKFGYEIIDFIANYFEKIEEFTV
jgi:hypothetical protein